jgi:hypothetical protein
MRATAAAVLALVSFTAHADDLWASIDIRSHHYTAGNYAVYNTETLGLGAEWATTPQQSWLAGWYHNSHHKPSIYAGLGEQPFNYQAFKAGVAIGLVTGYPAADVLLLLAVIASYDGARYGSNLVISPPIGHFAAGSISLQFKVRTDLLSR